MNRDWLPLVVITLTTFGSIATGRSPRSPGAALLLGGATILLVAEIGIFAGRLARWLIP